MKNKTYFIITLFLLIAASGMLPQEEIIKEYRNNIFAGGKERMFSLKSDIRKIDIYLALIDVQLYEGYSVIKACYYIKNNGEAADIFWAYPKLDADIAKEIDLGGPQKIEPQKIKGDFKDYKIFIDRKEARYDIQTGKEIELSNPYKLGDIHCNHTGVGSRQYRDEKIDTYSFYYSWYVTPLSLKKNEKKEISISYETPHYYNTIRVNNSKDLPVSPSVEDPALKYSSSQSGTTEYCESEKIFSYNLNTAYSDKERAIRTLIVRLKANIIDIDFLRVFPTNLRRNGNTYVLKYGNLKAKPFHNILIKISPSYAKDTVDPIFLTYTPQKTVQDPRSFYELPAKNKEILISFKGDNPDNSMSVGRIDITPEDLKNPADILKINKPLKFEIEFSQSRDFKYFVKETRVIKEKDFIAQYRSHYFVTIYKGRSIPCKFVRIKVLSSTNENEPVRIGAIELLQK